MEQAVAPSTTAYESKIAPPHNGGNGFSVRESRCAWNTAISTSRARHGNPVKTLSLCDVWQHHVVHRCMNTKSLIDNPKSCPVGTSLGPEGSAAFCSSKWSRTHLAMRVSTMGKVSGATNAGNVATMAITLVLKPNSDLKSSKCSLVGCSI